MTDLASLIQRLELTAELADSIARAARSASSARRHGRYGTVARKTATIQQCAAALDETLRQMREDDQIW